MLIELSGEASTFLCDIVYEYLQLSQVIKGVPLLLNSHKTHPYPQDRKFVSPSRKLRMTCTTFDPHTGFISKCVLHQVDLVASLLIGVLCVGFCFVFRGRARGVLSWREWVSVILIIAISTSKIPSVSAVGPFSALALQLAQMGRTLVTPPLLSLWWLFSIIMSFCILVDNILTSNSAGGIISFLCAILGLWLSLPAEKSFDFDSSSLFSVITRSYIGNMLSVGRRCQIYPVDLPKPAADLQAKLNLQRLDAHLTNNLTWALLSSAGWKLTLMLFLEVSSQFLGFCRPYMLRLFLSSLHKWKTGENASLVPSYWLGVTLGFLPLVATALKNYSEILRDFNGTSARTALTMLIYQKAMRLAPASRYEFNSAKIMNLIDIDSLVASQLADGSIFGQLFSAPIAFMAGFTQLWTLLGRSLFAGILYYALLGCFFVIMIILALGWTKQMMAAKDQRIKLTTSVFRGIKSLKLYGWIEPFYFELINARIKELSLFRLVKSVYVVLESAIFTSQDFVAILIFLAFLSSEKGALTPEIVFPTVELLVLVLYPFVMIPDSIAQFYNVKVSVDRIYKLLAQHDICTENYHHSKEGSSASLKQALIAWDGPETRVLEKVTLQICENELVCIIGRVGCGKTALLRALCGEMHILSGSVSISGDIAYCSQKPWLQNTTVLNNITFGHEFDSEWYSQVLKACSLVEVIEGLAKGDQTEVGERGFTLSSGQRARVSLARAIYSRASVYLLDDILSAVDHHVATSLISNVFSQRGILKGSTIVLATHDLRLLMQASKVVFLAEGTVLEAGTMREIFDANDSSPTFQLMRHFGVKNLSAHNFNSHEPQEPVVNARKQVLPLLRPNPDTATTLVGQEEEEKDKVVSFNVYSRFLSSSGKKMVVSAISFIMISSFVTDSIPLVLSAISAHRFSTIGEARWYIWLYAVVAFSVMIFLGLRDYSVNVRLSVKATLKLHNEMLASLLHVPMRFFDSTPLGRILNRFSGGLESIMTIGPFLAQMLGFLTGLSISLSTVVITSPIELMIVVPMVYMLNQYRIAYVSSSRQVRRMTAAANTPILTQVEETIKGGPTIRAFGRLAMFEEKYEACADYWVKLNFVGEALSGWLSWRTSSLSATLKVTTCISLTYAFSRSHVNAGLIGAVLIFTDRVGSLCGSFVRDYSQLEIHAVELQRIMEYIDIDQEMPAHIPETNPRSNWPSEGVLHVKGLTVRYGPDGREILHNLTFSLSRHEKIGVVGQTGAGKSTFVSALFRLVEAAEGDIKIDGININKLGLTDLRSRLSIIPQDCHIFNGTIRFNLDPNGRETDEKLWSVLEMCHLKRLFSSLHGLDTALDDESDNISLGQTQLVCLARALLNPSQLVVLDEPTSSVDLETDRIMQETIRSEFKDHTVIAVAHRLETIERCNRILVLKNGEIVEFDTPTRLLEMKGVFWSLKQAHAAN